MTTLLEAALAAHDAGLAVLPAAADGSKRPAVDWKRFQAHRPTRDEVERWFSGDVEGLGYVCGAVSGNLELIEIEGRARHLEDEIKQAARACGLGDVYDRIAAGYTEISPSGGIHWLYRCETPVDGNLKLARRPGDTPGVVDVLIETRGEGGWVVAAPSHGTTHPTGNPWVMRRGSVATIATITADERRALLDLCRTFDRMPEHVPPTPRISLADPRRPAPTALDGDRPGDTYMRATDWADLLEPEGWTLVFERDGARYWRRPGKTFGVSAVTNGTGTDRLKVFTSSTVFDNGDGVTYDKLRALAVLKHGGDFSAAVRAVTPSKHDAYSLGPRALSPARLEALGAVTGDAQPVDDDAGRELVLTPASKIKPRRARWLWEGRIPLGSLSLLGGREGIGKSTFAYDLVADLTLGKVPGEWRSEDDVASGQPGQPRDVLVAATEDSWEHTIVPRLMVAKADLDRVYRVEVHERRVPIPLTLPTDVPALVRTTGRLDVALLLLDPLVSRLSKKLDTHKDAEVRQALEPLTDFADDTGVAILGIIHVNKGQSTDPLTSLMGSRAFPAVARSVLFVIRDAEDPEIRYLGFAKNNLGRMDWPVLPYRIVDALAVADDVEGEIHAGKLSWARDVEMTATLLDLVEAQTQTSDERSALSEAAMWLTDWLKMHGGIELSKTIKEAGKKEGHADKTLQRAAKRVGLETLSYGFPRRTFWKLPDVMVVAESEDKRSQPVDNSQSGPIGAHSLETGFKSSLDLTEIRNMDGLQSSQVETEVPSPRERSPLTDPTHPGDNLEPGADALDDLLG